MPPRQAPRVRVSELSLASQRLGPLPLVNHFVGRLGLDELLDRYVPTRDRRRRLPYAQGLGVLLRSILVEREPIYRQQETVATYAPEAFGLEREMVARVGDDAIGRALDRLFDADRGSLLTAVVLAAGEAFGLCFDELHNDSTTIRFCGQYAGSGRSMRGKRTPWVTYGYSKDHRPDLKQLLFVLTTTRDGAVPAQFRCEDGNTNDARTHQETWDALRRITGHPDFLYVADSKLCSADAMDHIERQGGRFVTVMPRSRREDAYFREWIQTHEPAWELVWDRPNPRRKAGPRDRWWTFRASIPSREAWPVIWVYSNLLQMRQGHRRQERIARAEQELEALDRQLAGKRPRLRSKRLIRERVDELLEQHRVARYLLGEIFAEPQHEFRQIGPGRPSAKTQYRRTTKRRWRLRWTLDEERIAYDRKSDGMYPLLTNDRSLSPQQVLEAHKRQPLVEKRFEQNKTVFEIAPVLLKNPGRVEAFFFLYFLALLVQALIERELRRAMQQRGLDSLPLYPEERTTQRPTAEQILRLYSLLERHDLVSHGKILRSFKPRLTPLQREVLDLLCLFRRIRPPIPDEGGQGRSEATP
jgi:transposase